MMLLLTGSVCETEEFSNTGLHHCLLNEIASVRLQLILSLPKANKRGMVVSGMIRKWERSLKNKTCCFEGK
jgi:hypothetical protein